MDIISRTKYTDNDLRKIIPEVYSIAQVLRGIGLKAVGGNYGVIKRRIKLLGLDIKHFTGQGHLKGKTHNWAKEIPLDEILIEGSRYGGSGTKLKKKIFKAGLLEERCYSCGITEWKGEKLSLELEHKNGDRTDNRIENLTILCPNCHSLTSTYRGRNKKNKARVVEWQTQGT